VVAARGCRSGRAHWSRSKVSRLVLSAVSNPTVKGTGTWHGDVHGTSANQGARSTAEAFHVTSRQRRVHDVIALQTPGLVQNLFARHLR
jgi:hypothetical protein